MEYNTKKDNAHSGCSPISWPRNQGGQLSEAQHTTLPPEAAVLTLCFTVHAVGIASDVPYRLKGHGLILTCQTRLAM